MLTFEQRELVAGNVGIACAVVDGLKIRADLFRDARSEAMFALCLAAEKFDPGVGAKFSTWAWVKVRWHLLTWLERRPMSVGAEPLDDHAEAAGDAPATDDLVSDREALQAVAEALSGVEKRVVAVALMALRGWTKHEIAERLGVSVSTVARLRRSAREALSPVRADIRIAEQEKRCQYRGSNRPIEWSSDERFGLTASKNARGFSR